MKNENKGEMKKIENNYTTHSDTDITDSNNNNKNDNNNIKIMIK